MILSSFQLFIYNCMIIRSTFLSCIERTIRENTSGSAKGANSCVDDRVGSRCRLGRVVLRKQNGLWLRVGHTSAGIDINW